MQPEEFLILGERLHVPSAFLASIYYEHFNDTPHRVEHLEAYVEWRRQLAAGQAVA